MAGQITYRGRQMSRRLLCRNCGWNGDQPAAETPGSFRIELLLWLILIVPGLIYSLWRISTRRDVCPLCRSHELLPADSPIGRKLAAELGLEMSLAAPVSAPAARAVALGRKLGRMFRRRG